LGLRIEIEFSSGVLIYNVAYTGNQKKVHCYTLCWVTLPELFTAMKVAPWRDPKDGSVYLSRIRLRFSICCNIALSELKMQGKFRMLRKAVVDTLTEVLLLMTLWTTYLIPGS